MNKKMFILKFISMTLVIVFLTVYISFASSEIVPAELSHFDRAGEYVEHTIFRQAFMSYYFSNLRDNIPEQNNSSSSFVATSMLLSYYDVFLNDDFIPEKYDLNVILEGYSVTTDITSTPSPGVMNDAHLYQELSSQDTAYRRESLRDIIIRECKEEYFNQYLMSFSSTNGVSSGDKYLLTPSEIVVLLQLYLQSVELNDRVSVAVEYEPSFSFITSKIEDDTPVMLCTYDDSNCDSFGMAMVAYDYSAYHNDIYVHSNLTDRTEHRGIEDTYIYCAIYLDTSLMEHTCSNNYHYRPSRDHSEDEYYCACDFTIPEHTHLADSSESLSLTYTSVDYDYHSYICHCGVVQEEHSLGTIEQYDNYYHGRECIHCGYMDLESHTFIKDPLTAEGVCTFCGLELDLDKVPIPITNIPIDGGEIGTTKTYNGITYTVINENGSFMLENGKIILSETDVKLYKEGNLDIDLLEVGYEKK